MSGQAIAGMQARATSVTTGHVRDSGQRQRPHLGGAVPTKGSDSESACMLTNAMVEATANHAHHARARGSSKTPMPIAANR